MSTTGSSGLNSLLDNVYEFNRSKINMHRRCRSSHTVRAPLAPLGSGVHSAPAWIGWLPANFIVGLSFTCVLQPVAGGCTTQRHHTNFLQKEK